jgi:DNA-binding NarL/FixJ family response regulator
VETIRVLIPDNQGPHRAGLASIPKAETNFTIVGEASNDLEAIDKKLALLSRIKNNLLSTITIPKPSIDRFKGR